MRRLLSLALIALVAFGIVGFGQAVGTKSHPYRLILVPSTDQAVVESTGNAIAAALSQITGLEIESFMTPNIPAAVSEYSTAEGDVFGFLSTDAYCKAFAETMATTGQPLDLKLVSARKGYLGYWAGYYVRRDSGITSLADLEGKTWGYPYPGSASGFKVPNLQLQSLGITVGGTLETGSHNASMVALYNGDVDFITGFFSPPLAPATLRQMGLRWEPGMSLDLGIWNGAPDTKWETAGRITGDLAWYVKDLREAFLLDGTYPDIVEKVTLIGLSDLIPNDGVSFVPGFSEADKAAIIAAIKAFIVTPEGNALFSNPGFYAWDGVQDTTDAFYDLYRQATGYAIPER